MDTAKKDTAKEDIAKIRAQIDEVDQQISALFQERMSLSAQIAEQKQKLGLPLLNQEREQEILERVGKQAAGELKVYLCVLFRTLFRLSKDYQQQLADKALSGQEHGQEKNIVLIGMPGCGKSCTGQELAKLTKRPLFDTDEIVVELAGKSIPQIFADQGEEVFRDWERQAVSLAANGSGRIIACGGGTVLNPQNSRVLGENGCFYLLERELSLLAVIDRPLSVSLPELYEKRMPIYRSLAAAAIQNDDTIAEAARRVWQAHQQNI